MCKRTRTHLYVILASFCSIFSILAAPSVAAPYAAVVIDARTGKVLHSRSADRILHPASLTKMMTLYIAFEAIENGEISADKMIVISANAAAEPASKLWMRKGSKIKLRYLVRAAAIKSANDAATAIAEAISGSEKAFIQRMNLTARAMGMNNTHFKNAHGLTQVGHQSTARDMTTLGRHILYDFPEYYHLFARKSAHVGIKNVHNTNRRLLGSYKGADGIKTGYTRAAGYNLVASAERGNERIIATVFGGKSTRSRNARVAELLDMGFARAPSHARLIKPVLKKPSQRTQFAQNFRPQKRPNDLGGALLVADKMQIQDAIVTASIEQANRPAVTPAPIIPVLRPQIRPQSILAQADSVVPVEQEKSVDPVEVAIAQNNTSVNTQNLPVLSFVQAPSPAPRKIVPRLSADGKDWGVSIGYFGSEQAAAAALSHYSLKDVTILPNAERRIEQSSLGYKAIYTHLSKDYANTACIRLKSKQKNCEIIGPYSS